MQIQVSDPVLQTQLFVLVLVAALILSLRRPKQPQPIFGLAVTDELKGFAILGVIFAHIGYFLSANTQFLFPLSVLAGVSVDLFLFLSGYGLTYSSLKNKLTIFGFYRKRLLRLFIPLWLIITLFFLLDYFVLHRIYSTTEIWQSYVGFYPRADLWFSLDSPLWYFSWILFYYLLFPLLFWRKIPWLLPLGLVVLSYFTLKLPLPIADDVINLYKVHFWAFPIGVSSALLFQGDLLDKFNIKMTLKKFIQSDNLIFRILRGIALVTLTVLFAYFSIYSGVGHGLDAEQRISLLTAAILLLIFLLKRFNFRFLAIVGIYSYEIYLSHWPILSRYDFLYKYLPPFLATALYIGVFLLLALIIQKIVRLLPFEK